MQFLIRNIALSVCLLVILQLFMCEAAKRDRKLMRQLKKGMPPSEKSFLAKHKCDVTKTSQRNDKGFARWQFAQLRCKNVEEAEISIAICEKRCTDPRTDQVLSSKYKSIPYKWAFKMQGRPVDGKAPDEQVVHLPISCLCGKSKRNHRNRTSKKRRKN